MCNYQVCIEKIEQQFILQEPKHQAAVKKVLLMYRNSTENLIGACHFEVLDIRGAKQAIRQNADVNAFGGDGWTPLTMLAESGDRLVGQLMLRLLLKNKADVNLPTRGGVTALMHAANRLTTCLLLKHGAKTHVVDRWGATALHYAAKRGDTASLRILVKRGLAVDAGDHEGRTPLMTAAYFRRLRCVKMLLRVGANRSLTSHNGWTALEWHEQGCKDMNISLADLLNEHASDVDLQIHLHLLRAS